MLNPSQNAAIASLASPNSPPASAPWPSLEDGLTLVFFGVLAGCMILEKRRPLRRAITAAAKASYRFNLITFLLNNVTLSLLSLPALYTVAESFSGYGLLSGWEAGVPKFLVCLLLLDVTLYGWHFLMHHCDWLWAFHRFHHSDTSLNVTSGLRFHPVELALEVLVRCAFIIALGVDAYTAVACQGIVSLFVLLHHANVRFPADEWLSWFFITPTLHRVHHSVLRTEHDHNYGEIFSIWDRLFGTLTILEPAAIGLPPSTRKDLIDYAWDRLRALITPARSWVPLRTVWREHAKGR